MSAVFSGYFKVILKLQSSQVKRTPIDIINESIIWKMNSLYDTESRYHNQGSI